MPIRDLIGSVSEAAMDYMEAFAIAYKDAKEKKTGLFSLKDKKQSDRISVAEYLTGERLAGFRPEVKATLSLDTNLTASLQDVQVLEDLFKAFQEAERPLKDVEIDQKFEADILKILSEYPPYKNVMPEQKFKTVSEFIVTIINPLREATQPARDEYLKDTKHKKFEALGFTETLSADDSPGAFSHATVKGVKINKPEKIDDEDQIAWFAKFIGDKILAVRETVGQEMMRLIIPYMAKTRTAKDNEGNVYVMSQEIEGDSLQDLESDYLKEGLNDGTITGLGRTLVMCLLMQETDAKLGNLIMDEVKRINKFDGDWCFAGLRDSDYNADFKISAEDLDNLPFIKAFAPYNWLDIYEEGQLNTAYLADADKPDEDNDEEDSEDEKEEPVIDPALKDKAHFQREVNETLMKILLLPSDRVNELVRSYSNDKVETDLLAKTLVRRIGNFRVAALANKSFQEYVTSPAAKEYAKQCMMEFVEFKTTSKNHIITEEMTGAVMGKFGRLQVEAKENMQKVQQEVQQPKAVQVQAPKEVQEPKPEDLVRPFTPERKRALTPIAEAPKAPVPNVEIPAATRASVAKLPPLAAANNKLPPLQDKQKSSYNLFVKTGVMDPNKKPEVQQVQTKAPEAAQPETVKPKKGIQLKPIAAEEKTAARDTLPPIRRMR